MDTRSIRQVYAHVQRSPKIRNWLLALAVGLDVLICLTLMSIPYTLWVATLVLIMISLNLVVLSACIVSIWQYFRKDHIHENA